MERSRNLGAGDSCKLWIDSAPHRTGRRPKHRSKQFVHRVQYSSLVARGYHNLLEVIVELFKEWPTKMCRVHRKHDTEVNRPVQRLVSVQVAKAVQAVFPFMPPRLGAKDK